MPNSLAVGDPKLALLVIKNSASAPLKLALAWFAEEAKPIPSDWALTWAGIPVYRGKDKFRELFAIRYREKYGEGLIVESNATKILIEYRPASNSMVGSPLKREINKSDIILVMEKLHEDKILQIAPEAKNRLFLLKEFAKINDSNLNIFDPMGGSLEFYQDTFATIKDAVSDKLFDIAGIWDSFSFKRYSSRSERVHFLLKKK